MKQHTLLILIFLGSVTLAYSQTPDELFANSNRINRSGMMVLGGWAIANMAQGTYGTFKYNDERKYFSQMNLMWNIVNVGIAGFALYQFNTTNIGLLTPEQMAAKHNQTLNLYLINAGLDVLYMAGGWYMIHASKKSIKNKYLLKGYGQSVILQGGFLFAFDLAMYYINQNQIGKFDIPLQSLAIGPKGFSLALTF